MKATVVLLEALTLQYKTYNLRRGIPQPVTNPKDIADFQTNGMVQVTIEDGKQKISSGDVTADDLDSMNYDELKEVAGGLSLDEIPRKKSKLLDSIKEALGLP